MFSPVVPLKVYVALTRTTSVLVGTALVALTEPLSDDQTAAAVFLEDFIAAHPELTEKKHA